jgi:hypothetical protein
MVVLRTYRGIPRRTLTNTLILSFYGGRRPPSAVLEDVVFGLLIILLLGNKMVVLRTYEGFHAGLLQTPLYYPFTAAEGRLRRFSKTLFLVVRK